MGIIKGSKTDKWLKNESGSLTLKEKLQILCRMMAEQKGRNR